MRLQCTGISGFSTTNIRLNLNSKLDETSVRLAVVADEPGALGEKHSRQIEHQVVKLFRLNNPLHLKQPMCSCFLDIGGFSRAVFALPVFRLTLA